MKHKIPLFYYDDGTEEDLLWVRVDGDEVDTESFIDAFSDRLVGTAVIKDPGHFQKQVSAARKALDDGAPSAVIDGFEITVFTRQSDLRAKLIADFEQCLPG